MACNSSGTEGLCLNREQKEQGVTTIKNLINSGIDPETLFG
ncbi:hypothetical protein DSBG_2226 [Desulfosporosinus sp. BG]|nr:hypothetical protein DSBG_2226 [Desulfosporosinus sp. BG]